LQRQAIERMIRKNEKALLAPALDQWRELFGPLDQSALDKGEAWFLATCHKHGLGPARILVDAGVKLNSWVPVTKAFERGFDDLAFFLATLVPRLESLEGSRSKRPHVLWEAARRGRADMLEALFARPEMPGYNDVSSDEKKLNRHEKELLALLQEGGGSEGVAHTKAALETVRAAKESTAHTIRANHLLLLLSKTPAKEITNDLGPVVAFFVGKGANINDDNPSGFSLIERVPLVFHAAISANVPMLRALIEQGACVRKTLTAPYMPHPIPTTMDAALLGIFDTYGKNKDIMPPQWETLEILAGLGIVMDQKEGSSLKKRLLACSLRPQSLERITRLEALAVAAQEIQQLEGAVKKAPVAGPTRRM
jgi:hypothetical protein